MLAMIETAPSDIIHNILRFLRILELTRLCVSSPGLYRRLNHRAAPHVWRRLRPTYAQHFRILTGASLADAQALHGIYDCVIRQQFQVTYTDGLPSSVPMPAWMYTYFTVLRTACTRGEIAKIRWLHGLYAEYNFVLRDWCASASSGPLRRSLAAAIRSLVVAACTHGRAEIAQWVVDTLDPDRTIQLFIGFVQLLITVSVDHNQRESLLWVLDYYAPSRATVTLALLEATKGDNRDELINIGMEWLTKTAGSE